MTIKLCEEQNKLLLHVLVGCSVGTHSDHTSATISIPLDFLSVAVCPFAPNCLSPLLLPSVSPPAEITCCFVPGINNIFDCAGLHCLSVPLALSRHPGARVENAGREAGHGGEGGFMTQKGERGINGMRRGKEETGGGFEEEQQSVPRAKKCLCDQRRKRGGEGRHVPAK